MKVVLYTTGCPMCTLVKSKLDEAGIPYEIETDQNKMLSLGFRSVPILQVEDQMLKSAEAIKWIEGEMKK